MRSTDVFPKHVMQTSRFQMFDLQWYFRTREGKRLGPFQSIDQAKRGAEVYIALMRLDVDFKMAS